MLTKAAMQEATYPPHLPAAALVGEVLIGRAVTRGAVLIRLVGSAVFAGFSEVVLSGECHVPFLPTAVGIAPVVPVAR